MTRPPITRPAEGIQRSRGAMPFFAVALGFTWLIQLPAVLAQRGIIPGPFERYMGLAALGTFGPVIAAVLMSRTQAGGAGVGALFRRMRTWRVGAQWYLVAIGIFAAIHVAGTAVYALFHGSVVGRWLYLPENAQHVAAMIVVPLGEEPGWRGFALPRLHQRHSPLAASLILGVAWALWHVMMFLLQSMPPVAFALGMLNIFAGSVIFSWIYQHTRGSLLIAVIAHAGAHLNNPTHALPRQITPFAVYTVAICVAACALVIGDRRVWRAPDAGDTDTRTLPAAPG